MPVCGAFGEHAVILEPCCREIRLPIVLHDTPAAALTMSPGSSGERACVTRGLGEAGERTAPGDLIDAFCTLGVLWEANTSRWCAPRHVGA